LFASKSNHHRIKHYRSFYLRNYACLQSLVNNNAYMPKQITIKTNLKSICSSVLSCCFEAEVHMKTSKTLCLFHNCDQIHKTGLVCTKWQGTLFTTNQLLHQWTNDPCVYHCQWFTGLLFLGLLSWACLMCSSAQVVFKWQWCDWKGTHLAVDCHMTGQIVWPSNWLLFVIFRTWMVLRWDLLAVSTSTRGKTCHSCSSPPPPTSTPILWSFVIVVQKLSKRVGNLTSCPL